jgi:cyclic pyranopterin phosphate synthase
LKAVVLPLAAPPTAAPDAGPLIDTYGRVHNNLRISVTDRCNLRCTYCMPEDVQFLERAAILSFEEIARFVHVATSLGVDKIRLTGGEPLMRKELPQLVRMLIAIPGIHDVALTTNALLLSEQAKNLHDAGLRRINISLDTLNPFTFRVLSRREGLDRVLAGIDAAIKAGFAVKLNAVILRGVNDADIVPLARFAREKRCTLRFIESMPIGAEPWDREKAVLADEIMAQIEHHVGKLQRLDDNSHAPSVDYAYVDGRGIVGVIASVSRPFCRQCNRLRLTADGKLRHCLFALQETDIRPLIRDGSDAEIAQAIRDNVWAKWEGHEINSARFIKPARTMHAIGG